MYFFIVVLVAGGDKKTSSPGSVPGGIPGALGGAGEPFHLMSNRRAMMSLPPLWPPGPAMVRGTMYPPPVGRGRQSPLIPSTHQRGCASPTPTYQRRAVTPGPDMTRRTIHRSQSMHDTFSSEKL